MDVILLVGLVVLDLILLGLVYFLNKQKFNPIDTLKELNHERSLLKEVRSGIENELHKKYQEFEDLYKKINTIAVELDHSNTVYSSNVKGEMQDLLHSFSEKMSDAGDSLYHKKAALGTALQKADEQSERLIRLIRRAEKLSMFFSKSVPYEEVLEEIEDKKYIDARHLLAKGLSPEEVSKEIGLDLSEVGLIASLR